MDAGERLLVQTSMRQLLAESAPVDLPSRLFESGWAELLDEDPSFAVSVLAEEQGRSLTASPALDLVLMYGAGLALDFHGFDARLHLGHPGLHLRRLLHHVGYVLHRTILLNDWFPSGNAAPVR